MNRERRSGAHEASSPPERRPETRTPPRKKKLRVPRPSLRTDPSSPRRRRRNRIFLICIAAAVLALLVTALLLPRQADGDFEKNMTLAREAYACKDYDNALRHLRRASSEQPDSEECLLLMADCYTSQGNLDRALELLRGMDLADARVSTRIGEIERMRRELEDAARVTVLGGRYDADTTNLVLDGMGVRDDELPEILQLYALDNLSLMNNEITDLSVLARLGGLDTLNLSGNRIQDITALSALTELRTLYLDGNPIADFTPLYGLSHLNVLSIRGVELSKEQLSALSAALPGCAILSDAARTEATDITIGGVSFKSDVTELDLSGLGIRDISALADCRDLKWLRLSDNEISDLTALMNLPGLEVLDVSGNALSDLRPLIGMSTLRTLNVSYNALLDTAAVGAMTGLTSLDLSGNALTDFSGLRKLRNLQVLRLRDTGIRDEDLEHLTGLGLLQSLALEDNGDLTDPAMGRLKDMLPTCIITYSELVYIARIGGEEYRSNQTELEIHGQNLTDLGEIDRMDRLETALLSGNKISNIYILQYSPSRFTLRILDLSSNKLEDISALSYLTAVEELNLSDNRIGSVQALMRLSSLRTLRLDGNPLSAEQIEALREALPETEIVF